MRNSKEKYENLIDSSILFSIDRSTEAARYRREAFKMVENLYNYLMILNSRKYESYALEIVNTAKYCIDNYDSSKGRFLNYFLASWKKTYGHVVGKELVEEKYIGIHFSEEEKRNIKKYARLAQSLGLDINSSKFEENIALGMGLSSSEITSLRVMINSIPLSGSIHAEEDGEEISILDMVESDFEIEKSYVEMESRMDFINHLEDTFDSLQDRQKPMMSMIITSRISLQICDDNKLLNHTKSKSFFDNKVYEDVVAKGEHLSAKEIADKFGVAESSISRSWKSFKDRLKENYKGWV